MSSYLDTNHSTIFVFWSPLHIDNSNLGSNNFDQRYKCSTNDVIINQIPTSDKNDDKFTDCDYATIIGNSGKYRKESAA